MLKQINAEASKELFFPFHCGPWTGSMDKRLGKARRLPSYDGRSMGWPVKEAER